MANWFISRHAGAIEWAKSQDLAIDHWVEHLEIEEIQKGDLVMGTLPISLAAQVCEKQAKFFFLSVNVLAEQRGKELTKIQLEQQNCELKPFYIKSLKG